MQVQSGTPPVYRTSALAAIAGVHPNTVRFYERIGLLSHVPRAANSYREFSARHLLQLRAIRAVYRNGWFSRQISAAALAVLYALRDWRLEDAASLAQAYLALIEHDLAFANETAGILERWASGNHHAAADTAVLSRREAAHALSLTMEQLRGWERSGLLTVPRHGPNRARGYGRHEMERLRIIKLLRQAGYSPAAILASLTAYDAGLRDVMLPALHSPEPMDGVSWVLAGDRLIEALEQARLAACELCELTSEAYEI